MFADRVMQSGDKVRSERWSIVQSSQCSICTYELDEPVCRVSRVGNMRSNRDSGRLSEALSWARSQTAGTAVGRGVGIEGHRMVTITTPRASARGTCQTAFLRAAFGRIEMAHPVLLFNVLLWHWALLSHRTLHWRAHDARRRWSAVHVGRVSVLSIRWVRTLARRSSWRSQRMSRGVAGASTHLLRWHRARVRTLSRSSASRKLVQAFCSK
jgi:hypothetical protein